ncbi:hypothetical protein A6A25_07075 [Saccharothrix sp. CB00851]|nr:hypothetical protein A6A25_07075 [Saccharothrix sp. CB00851]
MRVTGWAAPESAKCSHAVRPQWFDYAGDLVVVEDPVSLVTPGYIDGGWCYYGLAPGKHPVYVGTHPCRDDDSDPDAFTYAVSMVVVAAGATRPSGRRAPSTKKEVPTSSPVRWRPSRPRGRATGGTTG